MKIVPYVHSQFERVKDDDYQTIDKRRIYALEKTIRMSGDIADCCSPNGSGIVETLKELGFHAFGMADAFEFVRCDWVVSNPPYKRGLVDKIINAQIHRLSNETARGVAMLLRNNFDFAKSRYGMFTDPFYWGQIHMMFRPWWSEERTAQPIHNYVWHIWKRGARKEPIVKYWREK